MHGRFKPLADDGLSRPLPMQADRDADTPRATEPLQDQTERLGKTGRVKRAVRRRRGERCNRRIIRWWRAIQGGHANVWTGNYVRATAEAIFVCRRKA